MILERSHELRLAGLADHRQTPRAAGVEIRCRVRLSACACSTSSMVPRSRSGSWCAVPLRATGPRWPHSDRNSGAAAAKPKSHGSEIVAIAGTGQSRRRGRHWRRRRPLQAPAEQATVTCSGAASVRAWRTGLAELRCRCPPAPKRLRRGLARLDARGAGSIERGCPRDVGFGARRTRSLMGHSAVWVESLPARPAGTK